MVEKFATAVWGMPTLLLFFTTGLFFTIKLRCLQLTGYKEMARVVFGRHNNVQTSDVSPFSSMCTALAASIGTGNIVGVCSAISVGGAGAVFWMCVCAFLSEATAYVENYLGVLFREKDTGGNWHGGAMYTLTIGLRQIVHPATAKGMGLLYAFLCAFSSVSMGNAVQVKSAADSMLTAFDVPLHVTGFICAVAVAVLLFCGRKAVAKMTQYLVPVSCFVFFFACVCVLIKQHHMIIPVAGQIFRSAFGLQSIGAGFSANMLRQGMITGVRRSIFSNEAGLGTSVAVHTAAHGTTAHEQGLRSMAEVFFDTVVMCTLTAFCVLCVPGAVQQPPGEMFVFALQHLFGSIAGKIVAICLSLFAFSTLVGWSFFGTESIRFVFGKKGEIPFFVLFCVIALIGSGMSFDTVWAVADIINVMLAFLNLLSLFLLSGYVKKGRKAELLLTT